MQTRVEQYVILTISILACIGFYFISQIGDFNYLLSSAMKVGLFVGIPLCYQRSQDGRWQYFIPRGKGKVGDLRAGFCMGLALFSIVIIAYVVCRPYIDARSITSQIGETSGVPKMLYPFAGLYATFGNSFVEEYFFRGFIFLNLKHMGHERLANLFSAGLFAIYHVAIIQTWFSIWVMMVVLVGLFIGGLIFNYMDSPKSHILNSWLVHIFTDVSVMVIATQLFY